MWDRLLASVPGRKASLLRAAACSVSCVRSESAKGKRHETKAPDKLQFVNEHKQSIIWLQSGCGLKVGVLGDHPGIPGI